MYPDISRFRFAFSPAATLTEFGESFENGKHTLEDWLRNNLQKLYIEVRSDSCPPKNEEFSTLALYLGLLSNLDESFEFVVKKFSYDFWKKLFLTVSYASMDSKIENIWIPELLEQIIELSAKGLKKRGLGEEVFLRPLLKRVQRKTTPAEETLQIFNKAGGGKKALQVLARKYGLFP